MTALVYNWVIATYTSLIPDSTTRTIHSRYTSDKSDAHMVASSKASVTSAATCT